MTNEEQIKSYIDLTKKINKAKFLASKYDSIFEDLKLQREKLAEEMEVSVFLEAWAILEKEKEEKKEITKNERSL